MDWILSFIGLAGFYLSGRKVWWSWYLNIACQALWLGYGLATNQWGFIVASVFYAVIFSRNAYLWTKEHKKGRESVADISGEGGGQ